MSGISALKINMGDIAVNFYFLNSIFKLGPSWSWSYGSYSIQHYL